MRDIKVNPCLPNNKGAICAKASWGTMKQYSPARLTKPLRCRDSAIRLGQLGFGGNLRDEALQILEHRLRHPRETGPAKFAHFTCRDPSRYVRQEFEYNKV